MAIGPILRYGWTQIKEDDKRKGKKLAWLAQSVHKLLPINLALHSTKNKISGENSFRKFQNDNYYTY